MRKLSHPIATFIVAVLVVIGVGVGVLAATMPLGHTTPSTIAGYPPFPPSSPGSFDSCIGRKPTGLTTARAARIIDRVSSLQRRLP